MTELNQDAEARDGSQIKKFRGLIIKIIALRSMTGASGLAQATLPGRRLPKPETVALLVFLTLLWFFVGGKKGVFTLVSMKQEEKSLQGSIVQLKQKNEEMRRRMESIAKDNLEVERIAREQLGMAHQDEVVFKFVNEVKK